jgi:hypothetical protein
LAATKVQAVERSRLVRDMAKPELKTGAVLLDEAMLELADLEASIDIDELHHLVQATGVVVSDEELRELFARLNTEGDEVISGAEFQAGLQAGVLGITNS